MIGYQKQEMTPPIYWYFVLESFIIISFFKAKEGQIIYAMKIWL